MNESKSNVPNMYQTIPAVASLNHVPGFEPLKLLRRTKSRKSNEPVLKLALPYKKLWFRLAHPKGRIQINRLKLTEQMAIYEAQVYLDRSDTVPISSFTASCTWKDAVKNDYIKEAQEEAIDEALSIAGFGLQFADMEMTKEAERFGSEVPLSAIQTEKSVSQIVSERQYSHVSSMADLQSKSLQPVKTAINHSPVSKIGASNIDLGEQKAITPLSEAESTKQLMKTQQLAENKLPIEETELPVSPAMESKSIAEQSEDILPVSLAENNSQEKDAEPFQDNLSATQRAMQILQRKQNVNNVNYVEQKVVAKLEQTERVEVPKYTRNTPVPEILKLMTFEEAKKVVVDMGTCKGKTMQEVAETRPASLKFYLFGGYKEGNNILLAAARIMYDYLESQKMGKAG